MRYFTEPGLESEDNQLSTYVAYTHGTWNALYQDRADRHIGFDILLSYIKDNFKAPTIIETGCIRCLNDWEGAGYQTFLIGYFVKHFGGSFKSIDNNATNLAFASANTEDFPIDFVLGDSKVVLGRIANDKRIDVLLLDSMDTDVQGHEDHCLAEAQSAMPGLHKGSIIVIDDTPKDGDGWKGKGAKAVPYLLSVGWTLLHQGYQSILVKS
jgi:hypothetical protein